MIRPLTIALCVHGYFPEQFFGTAVYVRHMAQALKELGHRPVVVSVRLNEDPEAVGVLPPEMLHGVEVRRILRPASRDLYDTFDDPRLVPALEQTFADIGADVVHIAHFLGLTAAIHVAAQNLNLPLFATFTDFHAFCHRGTLLNSWERSCKGPSPRRLNCVSCGLRDFADDNPLSLSAAYFGSWFARPTSAWVMPPIRPVLPAAVARDISAIIDRPDILRRRIAGVRAAIAPTQFLHDTYRRQGFDLPLITSPFGIVADRTLRSPPKAGPIRVGFIGQIGKHKGPHLLIEAARHLPVGRFQIEVWGDVARHPLYGGKLLQRSHGRSIKFRGALPLEAMDVALRSMDVLVLPSLWAENAPLTLLQALACHTPCIVTDRPGMTEFIRDGVNGMVMPSGNARDLVDALLRIENDREMLRRLTDGAHYERTPLDMAEDLIRMYAEYGEWK